MRLQSGLIDSSLNEEWKFWEKDHSDALKSMNEVKSVLNCQGKYVESEKSLQETLALNEKVLGKEHPKTMTSMINLRMTLSNQGRHAESKILTQKLKALYEKMKGKEDSNMLNLINHVLVYVHNQDKCAYSEHIQEMLTWSEKALCKEDPVTLNCMNMLTAVLFELTKYEEAETMI